MIKFAYINDSISRLPVFERFSRFQVGKESIEDSEKSGRPYPSRNEETVQHVQLLMT